MQKLLLSSVRCLVVFSFFLRQTTATQWCRGLPYTAVAPASHGESLPSFILQLQNVVLHLDRGGSITHAAISKECAALIQPFIHGDKLVIEAKNNQPIPLQSTTKDALVQQSCQCVQLKDTYYWTSDRMHFQHNLYDSFTTDVLPLFMAKQQFQLLSGKVLFLWGKQSSKPLQHPELYAPIGDVVHDWGRFIGNASCLHFESVATSYEAVNAFMTRPVLRWPQIKDFATTMLRYHGLEHIQPDACKPTLLLANRDSAPFRRLLNKQEMLEHLRAQWPALQTKDVDLSTLPFAEQVSAVRSSHIFVFSHGAAGVNVLWLVEGAVAIEIFPFAFSDPMFRSLATSNGITYLAYQNNDVDRASFLDDKPFYDPAHRGNRRQSHTIVDLNKARDLVFVALAVSASNIGLQFKQYDWTDWDTRHCVWCGREDRGYKCSPDKEKISYQF